MSLFSYIKRRYYNQRLKRADDYAYNGNYVKAKSAYLKLIPHHPEAVTHLAKMSLENQTSNDLDHYKTILNYKSLLIPDFSNSYSFNRIEQTIFDDVKLKIDSFIRQKNYKESIKWIEFVLSNNNDLSLRRRNDLILLINKCRYSYALELVVQDRKKAEKIVEDVYKQSEKHSFPPEFATILRNSVLNIAKLYIRENDIINANYFLKLILTKEPIAKELFINTNISNIDQIKTDQSAVKFLFDTINSIEDKKIICKNFEVLLEKIPVAGEHYVLSIISMSLDYINDEVYSEALDFLLYAQSKKTDDRLYDLQKNIAQKYIAKYDYDEAINVLFLLIGKHKDAEPLLANCYLKKSEKIENLDLRRNELLKAFKFKETHSPLFNSSLYDEIFPHLINNLLAIAKKYAVYEYFNDAYSLLSMLFPYSQEAIEEHINTKVLAIYKVHIINEQIILFEELLQFGKQKLKNPQTSNAVNKLFNIIIDKTLTILSQEQNIETKINELTRLSQRLNDEEFLSKETALQKVQQSLALISYEHGIGLEKNLKIEEAINVYTKIINELKSDLIKEGVTKNDVLGRIFICRLKKGEINPKGIENLLLQELSIKIKRDLAYRYSVFLFQQQSYEQAWNIANKYLPTTKETEIIRKKYKLFQISNAFNTLDAFNEKIKKIKNKTLTLDDALDLYENLSEIEASLVSALPDVKGKIVKNRDAIFNYILYKYFESEEYSKYLDIIEKLNTQFYLNDNLLRNVAIAALGIVQTGQLNENNYKDIISYWLTAVFRDRLFIKSLNYTTWDDEYNFTLNGSLGRISEYENLPDNMNFEESSSNNFSIGDVQRSLLSQFEQELNECCNSVILHQVLKFYDEEKDAIKLLYQTFGTKDDFFASTPHFAKTHSDVHESLSKYLNRESDNMKTNNETLLNIGLIYNVQGKKYKDFFEAKILSSKSIDVIKGQNTAQIKLIFSTANVNKIKVYRELYEKLVSNIQNCLSEHIHDSGSNYKNIITNYLIVCRALPDPNIKFTLANFAYNECYKRLSTKSISIKEALELLKEVQNVIPDNAKINNSIPDIQLSDLIEKFNNKKISLSDGLTKFYDLYKSYPDHQRICDSLVTICSDAIFSEIMMDSHNSSQVQNILNKIVNNRSSTFRISARDLAIQRSDFMRKLPPEVIVQLELGSLYSLNSQGLAIKRGLDYLKQLSQ